MPWYWIVVIIVSTQGLFVLVQWLLSKRGLTQSSLNAINDSEAKRAQDVLAATLAAKKAVDKAYGDLDAKTKAILLWYTQNREYIDDQARKEFETLSKSDGDLDGRLLDVLGSGSVIPK